MLASTPNLWPAAPFACILLAIVVGPGLSPALFHRPARRLALLCLLAAPAFALDLLASPLRVIIAIEEYLAFVSLLAALFVLADGIRVTGPFSGRPLSNAAALLAGALLANGIGTTGASMLLLPPVLSGNAGRRHTAHVIVFFIFVVSNVGGMLTPLGDPPLFLGYLHGVPFWWTLRLWPAWSLTLSLLLAAFLGLDSLLWRAETAQAATLASERSRAPFALAGTKHLLGLACVIGLLAVGPSLHLPSLVQSAGFAALAGLGRWLTLREQGAAARGRLEPLIEVATLFLPLFIALPQALDAIALAAQGTASGTANAYFWATGALSSVLDNAPCYLSFAALAAAEEGLDGHRLTALALSLAGSNKLAAIAFGAVSMGAMTYLGNGPNLLVREKAIAAGHRPPSQLGYLLWSMGILLPVLALVRLLMP